MSVCRAILLTFCVFCSAVAFAAGGAATLLVRTDGPDRYADGTAAAAGELYAAVWVADGATCAFLADGTLEESANCRLIGHLRTGFVGCCAREYRWAAGEKMPFAFEFGAAEMRGFDGGRFELHLLDTRTPDGTPTVRTDGAPARIVSSTQIASVTLADVRKGDEVFRLRENPVSVRSALPGNAPRPVITGCKTVTVGGEDCLELTLKRTVHYLDYDLAKGVTPAMADATPDAAERPVGGSATDDPDEPITIRVRTGGAKHGFFRVVRHGSGKGGAAE